MAYFQGHSFSAIHLNHQYAICYALRFCNKSKLKVHLGTPYKALSKSTTSITEFTDTTIFIKTTGLPVLHLKSTIKNHFAVLFILPITLNKASHFSESLFAVYNAENGKFH